MPIRTPEQGMEAAVQLPEMPLSEHVVNDYQTVKLSLKAHPMSFLRGRCAAEKVTDNGALKSLRNGRAVTVAGVVLVRQRPGSAKGVVFLTLEDEFSVCNVVIWPDVLEAHRATVMGARLMLIRGRVQKTGDIIHVVANIASRTRPSGLRHSRKTAHPAWNPWRGPMRWCGRGRTRRSTSKAQPATPAMCGCCRRAGIFIEVGRSPGPRRRDKPGDDEFYLSRHGRACPGHLSHSRSQITQTARHGWAAGVVLTVVHESP
jgi:hypothetical protein